VWGIRKPAQALTISFFGKCSFFVRKQRFSTVNRRASSVHGARRPGSRLKSAIWSKARPKRGSPGLGQRGPCVGKDAETPSLPRHGGGGPAPHCHRLGAQLLTCAVPTPPSLLLPALRTHLRLRVLGLAQGGQACGCGGPAPVVRGGGRGWWSGLCGELGHRHLHHPVRGTLGQWDGQRVVRGTHQPRRRLIGGAGGRRCGESGESGESGATAGSVACGWREQGGWPHVQKEGWRGAAGAAVAQPLCEDEGVRAAHHYAWDGCPRIHRQHQALRRAPG
jgi:hypothetical protein